MIGIGRGGGEEEGLVCSITLGKGDIMKYQIESYIYSTSAYLIELIC